MFGQIFGQVFDQIFGQGFDMVYLVPLLTLSPSSRVSQDRWTRFVLSRSYRRHVRKRVPYGGLELRGTGGLLGHSFWRGGG